MPRTVWSGSISFGMVSVPVKLHSATTSKSVSFTRLERETGAKVKNKRVSAATGDEVAWDDITRGYEVAPGEFVIIEDDDIEDFMPKKSREISIKQFVEIEQIDPLLFTDPYYLAPAAELKKPYRLLVDALEQTGKVAIAQFVMRSKQNLAAIWPHDGHLVLSKLLWADELAPASQIEALDDLAELEVADAETKLAVQLIEAMSEDFDPKSFTDDYRQQLLDLIGKKAAGEEIVRVEDPEDSAEILDLRAALERSLSDSNKKKASKKSKKSA